MSGSDDLGGLGDLDEGDDLGDFDDDFEGEDGFGEMEGGDDGMAGGGGNLDELEHRLDELENEVGSLSSTVNTVRNENEQISNSVEEVEENVRKLLDIYEMVTRGVNPFADEMDGMGMGGGMDAQDSSFGLFTDDGEGEQDESVDDDIADADAEGFFDDDLVDDEPADEMGMGAGEALDEDDASDDGDEFDDVGEEFDELDDGFDDAAGEFDDADEAFEGADEGEHGEVADETEFEDDELFDDVVEEEAATGTSAESGMAAESGPEPAAQTQSPAGTESETVDGGSPEREATDSGKPYLTGLPGEISGELVVIEWLEFLVDAVGNHRAAEAIEYYESIDWITETAAAGLAAHLDRFEPRERGALTVAVHRESLAYIDQLNGGDTGAAIALERGDLP